MVDSTAANLATNVRRLREERDLTQRQLADVSGVPRPTLANIESGTANPTIGVLIKVADALGTTIERLIARPRSAAALYERDTLASRMRGRALIRSLMAEPALGVTFDRVELATGGSLSLASTDEGKRHYLSCEAGELEVKVEDEVLRVRSGDLVVSAGSFERRVTNRGRGKAVLYAVSAPAPLVS